MTSKIDLKPGQATPYFGPGWELKPSRIRKHRRIYGLSLAEFARAVGISFTELFLAEFHEVMSEESLAKVAAFIRTRGY